ncbi:hypothetical protein RZE82_03570 [Mollicutes bacterium LVI A0039]|nr:hypothetical protein RZE82_03570 [Mollicutes bacterium LVI A0039]
MHIEIPNSLLKYKTDIEMHAEVLTNEKNINLKLVGQTKRDNVFKELYIMYNPHMNDLNINLNSFKHSKDVYKMHPSEFVLASGDVQAFLVFSPNNRPLQIDDSIVTYEYKTAIESNIATLIKKYNLQSEYKKPRAKIELVKQPEISNTIALTQNLPPLNTEYTKLNKANQNNVKLHIKSVKRKGDRELINCVIKNVSGEDNILIEHIKIRFVDTEAELKLNMHQTIRLKAKTYKEVMLKVDSSKFAGININKASVRVLIS